MGYGLLVVVTSIFGTIWLINKLEQLQEDVEWARQE